MTTLLFVLYPLSCIFIPCGLYILIQTVFFRQRTTFAHIVWVSVFLLYIYMVLETTGIGTIWDIGAYPDVIMFDKINLIPLNDGLSLSMILNVIMFMPLGFLLPLLWRENKSLIKTALTGFLFSLGIEFCQLFNNRASDVDDLLMNTLGSLIGWCIWIVFAHIVPLKYGKRNHGYGSPEPAAYLFLALAGQFFLYNWRWMLHLAGY